MSQHIQKVKIYFLLIYKTLNRTYSHPLIKQTKFSPDLAKNHTVCPVLLTNLNLIQIPSLRIYNWRNAIANPYLQ